MSQDTEIQNEIPVACSLTAEGKEERGPELSALFSSADEVRELPRGYAFRYAAETGIAARVLNVLMKERECCPFFEFKLEFRPGNGPLWFYIEGPEGTKELLGRLS